MRKESMARIAQEFGIPTPLVLTMMAENNEETYTDILIRHIRSLRSEEKSSAESAEARVAALEGELSEAREVLSSIPVKLNHADNCTPAQCICWIKRYLKVLPPTPLPAQAPEEQSLEAQTILRLTKQLDRWRSNIRNVVLQGDKTPMDDETLRDRAYTAIDTRVADERRLAKEANSRAESAEARVKALEGELAAENRSHEQTITERDDAEQALSQAYYLVIGRSPEWSNNFGHRHALEEIEAKLTSPTPVWIPVSTPPTEGDADKWGDVLWLFGTSARVQKWYDKSSHHSEAPDAIGWFKLPPLPSTSPPGEETERKAAKKAYDKYVEDAPNGRVATFADFLIGWQAARQSTPKTEV